MKKIPVLISFLFCASVLFAQTQSRNVGSFHAVEVSNGIYLTLKQGSTNAVSVSASTAEFAARIKTEVENGELKIYFDSKGLSNLNLKNKELKAYVTFKDIDALEANSGADAITDGNLNAGNLKLTLSSGANFKGEVTASKLWVDQSSGSDMDIKGKVGDVEVKTSSGSDFNGYDLVSDNCKADASSGSDIEITVNKALQAEASSGGGINYKGSASITNISHSSGGKIKKQS